MIFIDLEMQVSELM